MSHVVWSSVTRIVDHESVSVSWDRRRRADWRTGDYVVARVESPEGGLIEAEDGHHVSVESGDFVVGVLGTRRATLEVVGDWSGIGADGAMQTLTRAGLFGVVTSASSYARPYVVELVYRGHLTLDGAFQTMADWALREPPETTERKTPVIALIGTSMSSGKTTTARILIRRLGSMGLDVVGAKLAGVARLADTLAMRDSGAIATWDFVDAGLPSTVAPHDAVAGAAHRILATVDAARPDVLVCEVGASPLEPYRGDAVLDVLGERVALLVLCASDPYAVVGAIEAFGVRPDFVAGRAAATSAARELVVALSDLEAIDVTDPGRWPRLDEIIEAAL